MGLLTAVVFKLIIVIQIKVHPLYKCIIKTGFNGDAWYPSLLLLVSKLNFFEFDFIVITFRSYQALSIEIRQKLPSNC